MKANDIEQIILTHVKAETQYELDNLDVKAIAKWVASCPNDIEQIILTRVIRDAMDHLRETLYNNHRTDLHKAP